MKPGGGHAKGSSWERRICQQLSLWISGNSRSDLFSRNVLSGGRFTIAAAKNRELGLPGDIAAAHPDAFRFLAHFTVEAKHRRDIALERYIWDGTGHNFLAHVWRQTAQQAERAKVHPMVIAKQNNAPPIVLLPCLVGWLALTHSFPAKAMMYHSLHKETVMMLSFEQMLRHVRPSRFLAACPDVQ